MLAALNNVGGIAQPFLCIGNEQHIPSEVATELCGGQGRTQGGGGRPGAPSPLVVVVLAGLRPAGPHPQPPWLAKERSSAKA